MREFVDRRRDEKICRGFRTVRDEQARSGSAPSRLEFGLKPAARRWVIKTADQFVTLERRNFRTHDDVKTFRTRRDKFRRDDRPEVSFKSVPQRNQPGVLACVLPRRF